MATKTQISALVLEHLLALPEGVRIERIDRIPGGWDADTKKPGPARFTFFLVADTGSDIELPEGECMLHYQMLPDRSTTKIVPLD